MRSPNTAAFAAPLSLPRPAAKYIPRVRHFCAPKANSAEPSSRPPRPNAKGTQPSPPPAAASRGSTLLLVGLGNPGERFTNTRHNIGFHLVDAFAARHAAAPFRYDSRLRGLMTCVSLADRSVLLLKPATFMNSSGDAVRAVLNYRKLPRAALLVVTDDIALDLGRVRLRARGSAGGHNGLKSVERAIGGDYYARLKVGVGSPSESSRWPDFVLGKFSRAEMKSVEDVEWDVMDVLDFWVQEPDLTKVMNKIGRIQHGDK